MTTTQDHPEPRRLVGYGDSPPTLLPGGDAYLGRPKNINRICWRLMSREQKQAAIAEAERVEIEQQQEETRITAPTMAGSANDQAGDGPGPAARPARRPATVPAARRGGDSD